MLRNRRERIEELTLEAQEMRAQRELGKLRRENQEEAEQREAEAQAREEETEQRRAEIALERERLARERAEDQRRRRQEQQQERERLEAEERLAAFRQRWYFVAGQAVAIPRLNWLTVAQRKEIAEQLESEIDRRHPADELRMHEIIGRSLLALVEPVQAARDALERRQRVTDEALRSLPYSATDADKVKATAAIREALRQFERFADACEMRVAIQQAVLPVRQAIQKRELDNRLLQGAVWKLPWGKTDQDEVRIRRECAEILADLPADILEPEAKEALEGTVRDVCREIEKRRAEAERQTRKASLIQQGVSEVAIYMAELERKGELTREEYWDSELTEHWRTIVRRSLESTLTGDESTKEVRELAREVMDGEIA